MGVCAYCGQSAGLFHSRHSRCEQVHNDGLRQIGSLLESTFHGSPDEMTTLPQRIAPIAQQSYVSEDQLHNLALAGWYTGLESYWQQSQFAITVDQATRLATFQQLFELTDQELKGGYNKYTCSIILREVREGRNPKRIPYPPLRINFQKNEDLIWHLSGAMFCEEHHVRMHRGHHQGFRFRIAKGVWLNTGTFQSYDVGHDEMIMLDTGTLAITDKNVYFDGAHKSFRLPYGKIVSFHSYADAVGLVKSSTTGTGKLMAFMTPDNHFAMELIKTLAAR